MTAVIVIFLSACSTNPATGEQQFTALMSPAQEERIGAREHEKIMKLYGLPEKKALQTYVEAIGQAVAANTERSEVRYKFFVLDTPMVNAFALPGGYVYVTRGLLTLANSEAELAAVLAHEVGHITARHSAERFSQSVLTSLGTLAVAAILDNSQAARAVGLGSNLYMKSYSRKQEHQADELGIRYVHRAGYDGFAMSSFLNTMGKHEALERRASGKGTDSAPFSYFSTHPRTEDRVAQVSRIAASYPAGKAMSNRNAYLNVVDGMVYGDGIRQGFVKERDFYHTKMGFTFQVPPGFKIHNRPSEIIAVSDDGGVILFDTADNVSHLDVLTYLIQNWMKDETLRYSERISINGLEAATAEFDGVVNKKPVAIRLVAIEWSPDRFFRFQLAIPRYAAPGLVEDMKRTTYSLRRLSVEEKYSIKPYKIMVVTAQPGDTVSSLAQRQPPDDNLRAERFRVLNSLEQHESVISGQRYKLISFR